MCIRQTGVLLVLGVVCLLGLFTGCATQDQSQESAADPGDQEKTSDPKIIQAYDFENGTGGWHSVYETLHIDASTEKKHEGANSLKVEGTSPEEFWNFAASDPFPLDPGKKYHLTGWMLLEALDENDYPPLLKCEIIQGTEWLANANTNKYDLSKKGEWQKLSLVFTTPMVTDIKGLFSVEKGTNDRAVETTLYIDDVKLELLK